MLDVAACVATAAIPIFKGYRTMRAVWRAIRDGSKASMISALTGFLCLDIAESAIDFWDCMEGDC